MNLRLPSLLFVVTAVASVAAPAAANERHFAYAYETAVLPPGARELELWTAPRLGRRTAYTRFDQRVELEVGITDRLLTAFYLNFTALTEEVAGGELASTVEFGGVSSEWKLKLLDPVADAIGLGLYAELTASTNALEVEGKILLDKRVGNFLFALNAVVEHEWERESANETRRELVFEVDLALAYFLTPNLSIGVEVRDDNEIPSAEGFEHSALFAGPVVSYAQANWWTTLTLMPQLAAFGEGGTQLDLADHERFNARLLFAFHL